MLFIHNTYHKGYNSTLGGQASLGYKHTVEAKKKMSEAKTGKKLKPFTKEHCKKISEAKVGKKHTEESKKKMSISKVGNTNMLGYKHTEESKKKMSESHNGMGVGEDNPMYGKHHTDITKDKIKNSLIGKKHTEDHKIKIARSLAKYSYKIIKPDETIEIIKNLAKYCRENNLSSSSMYGVIKGKCTQHKGYRCKKINATKE